MDSDNALDNASEAASSEEEKQQSAFLTLPVDVFKCITDYLDRDAAWSLKRVCRGLSRSEVVNRLLYKYPIQLSDVRDIRLSDWKYRSMGRLRWISFQQSINDSNRAFVQKLALSHWCSIDDFIWIEKNLPSLVSLDITSIKDFVWSPEQLWTWKELAEATPKLFARLDFLEVANWSDYTAHSRIEYSYSYNDYRFKPKFRISRRRDGGSVAKMIFPICTQLKSLAIRERYSGFHTWNEWEVHQRVCCLIDGISSHCPPTLSKLRVYDYAPYRSLFSTDVTTWQNLSQIEIGLYSWMEERRDRDVIGPIPYRITPGHHHRDDEEAFDDKTFDTCDRNHMELGQHVVQGVSASFEDLLLNLRTITSKYPTVNVRPIHNSLRDIVLHPFHLVNVNQRRFGHPPQQQQQVNPPDPVSSQEIQEALRWLAEKCGWKPVLAWDSMMCDVFPANLEANRTFLPKADLLSRIRTMVQTLKTLNIPIRLSIGDRTNNCPSSGLDGSLYFGDYKCFVGEDDNKREILAPTQARFNLTGIAHLVDELTIQYPVDVPGVAGWGRSSKRPTEAELELLRREARGWARFWARYALQFKNLKKLTATIPDYIYNGWGKSGNLRELLKDERWDMLQIDEKFMSDFTFFGGYLPFSNIRYGLAKKKPRMKFVQRVFFRQDTEELQLNKPSLSDQELEENEILDSAITPNEDRPPHRFWPPKALKGEKRKVEEEEGKTMPRVKRVKVE
ncbi:uncharacterized protein BDR25DRAFT_217117 [Lindgomyces ingoldianus]|uniref:Uncharacterized protein n=1 Tax=Lindgomyces ingoldianus TaxID=673940 RepID=A0ACB6R3L3_9PLEO|nr:uncharacterized protein BDR25DRAFT_217117 [Lindgomyces ingoldianus]KAF2473844.1 hypothetical protein BDR25DRAFT_217117 [Lindgomyces ingoldianus]